MKNKLAIPEFVIADGKMVIIVEIDENSHKYYEKPCELGRYDTLKWRQKYPEDTVLYVLRFTSHLKASHEEVSDRLGGFHPFCIIQ